MALNSVNTNNGALIALQNLNATNNELSAVQGRINTGKKVGSAKDNGAVWAIAQTQRGTSNALNAVKDSLQRGQSTIDVAIAAGESVSDLLLQMKEKALAASDTTLDTTSRSALNEDFKALRDQITKAVTNADFNGANMIKASGNTVTALANADGTSKITVAAQSLALGGSNVTVAATASLSTATIAATLVTTVSTSISNVGSALAKLGTGSKSLEIAPHLRRQAARQPRRRCGQPGRRRSGQGKRQAAGPANQATARRAGAVDRQQLDVLPARTVPLRATQKGAGGQRRPPRPRRRRSRGLRHAHVQRDVGRERPA